jgi:hypothetical protein
MGESRYFPALSVALLLTAFLHYLPIASGQPAPEGKTLFLLKSDIQAPKQDNAAVSTELFSVSPTRKLRFQTTVLEGSTNRSAQGSLPEGVFSIHELGQYLVVEYPYDVPCCVIFIPKDAPFNFESIKFVPSDMVPVDCGLGVVNHDSSTVCDLWELVPTSFALDGNQRLTEPVTTLRSVCKKQGAPAYLEKDQWVEYNGTRSGWVQPQNKICGLSSRDGVIVHMFLGMPSVPITDLPPKFRALSGIRGVDLKAASDRYLVVSLDSVDGIDRNSDVYAQSFRGGAWQRLNVPAVIPTNNDSLRYSLFGDWLITSLSASLASTITDREKVISDMLTIKRGTLGTALPQIEVQQISPRDLSSLPARILNLYNLADARRIALTIPEDDSEIIQIFGGNTVLLRIKDKLFFADVQGSRLGGYRLVAENSAISQIHWAFYGSP